MGLIRKAALPDNSCGIPQEYYNVAIVEAKAQKSKRTGADMIVLKLEILSPKEVPVEGKLVRTQGRKFDHYIVASENDNRWVKEIETLLGDELPAEVDSTELAIGAAADLQGMVLMNVSLKAEERYKNQPGTYEPEIVNGQKVVTGYGIRFADANRPRAISAEAAGLA